MRKALEHRLRHHHPRFAPYWPLPNIFLGMTHEETIMTMKPRCTFAELGKDCPIVKELKSNPQTPETE